MTRGSATKALAKQALLEAALKNPTLVTRELNDRSLYRFLQWAWPAIEEETPLDLNWHLEYLCGQLEEIAYQVGGRLPKDHDLIINIPPGTTKTKLVSIIFPVWCWTKWYWMKFITISYSASLALESAETSRDLVRHEQFKAIYPELRIKEDKDAKGNFMIVKYEPAMSAGRVPRKKNGGTRYSTSIGGTLTGFHGDIIIWDDPLNPHEAVSEVKVKTANHFLDRTLPTRKTDKRKSATIGIMQRLAEDDPTGHQLNKKKKNQRHICLPGEIRNYKDQLKPAELAKYYQDDLLDVNRMNWTVLEEMETELGQYGFAGQFGQDPSPPGGGMFKVDNFVKLSTALSGINVVETIRYWDKAGTKDGGAYTTGVRISKLSNNKVVIEDVVRGQWASEERERIIRQTAENDGDHVMILVEQEPGSGGLESAQNTIRNLAGYNVERDLPKGDKVYRADPLSVQVNNGNVIIFPGDWVSTLINEFRYFPYGKFKDQVDAASAAFNYMMQKQMVETL